MDRVRAVLLFGCCALLPAVAAMFAVSSAHANPQIRLSLGANTSKADAAPVPPLTQTNLSDEFGGTEMRASFGVTWSGIWAFEFGLSDFGSRSGVEIREVHPTPGSPAPPGPPVLIPMKQSGSAYWLAYTPSWQRGPLQLSAKLGLARTSQSTVITDSHPTRYDANNMEIIVGGAATALERLAQLRREVDGQAIHIVI